MARFGRAKLGAYAAECGCIVHAYAAPAEFGENHAGRRAVTLTVTGEIGLPCADHRSDWEAAQVVPQAEAVDA